MPCPAPARRVPSAGRISSGHPSDIRLRDRCSPFSHLPQRARPWPVRGRRTGPCINHDLRPEWPMYTTTCRAQAGVQSAQLNVPRPCGLPGSLDPAPGRVPPCPGSPTARLPAAFPLSRSRRGSAVAQQSIPIILDPTGADRHTEHQLLRAQGAAARVDILGVQAWSVTAPTLLKELLTSSEVSKDGRRHWPAVRHGHTALATGALGRREQHVHRLRQRSPQAAPVGCPSDERPPHSRAEDDHRRRRRPPSRRLGGHTARQAR